ncbi:hypothetical protein QP834_15055, partial [Enterococcus faecalis]|nr:hypothetical protein [Enterococcus faecalis]
RKLVAQARERARERWRGTPWTMNAHVPSRLLHDPKCGIEPAVYRGVERAIEDGTLSLRGADRVLRLALTIADVRGARRVGLSELVSSLKFRNGVDNANS